MLIRMGGYPSSEILQMIHCCLQGELFLCHLGVNVRPFFSEAAVCPLLAHEQRLALTASNVHVKRYRQCGAAISGPEVR